MYIEQGEYFSKKKNLNSTENIFLIRMLYRTKLLFPHKED